MGDDLPALVQEGLEFLSSPIDGCVMGMAFESDAQGPGHGKSQRGSLDRRQFLGHLMRDGALDVQAHAPIFDDKTLNVYLAARRAKGAREMLEVPRLRGAWELWTPYLGRKRVVGARTRPGHLFHGVTHQRWSDHRPTAGRRADLGGAARDLIAIRDRRHVAPSGERPSAPRMCVGEGCREAPLWGPGNA
jgi:hypothetical protein